MYIIGIQNYNNVLELFHTTIPNIELTSQTLPHVDYGLNKILKTIAVDNRKEYIMDGALILIEHDLTGDELIT